MTTRHAATLALIVAFVATGAAKEPGPVVLYRIMEKVPVELRDRDGVGVMLINDGGKENPIPRYVVAIAASRTVVDTRDLDLFRATLSRLPKGTKVGEYDSCTVPQSWGLKEEHYDSYYESIESLGLSLSKETRVTCTCDATSRPVKRTPAKP